ncbi:MAG: hypothetical protein ABI867_03460 [Kofleriaceae bacterium]
MFSSVDRDHLVTVVGGAARVTSKSGSANSEITTMLTQVTDSIKDLAKGNQGGQDPMQMMMMMMMMGGGGGGGGGAPAQAAPPPPPAAPVVSIRNSIR